MTALVPGAVCAAAVGRNWPYSLDEQVRCIDEGTRALGLAHCCAPWSIEAEDAALRAEMGDQADLVPGSAKTPTTYAEDCHDRDLESLASCGSNIDADIDGDAVAAGLVRVASAPPVVGLISGPLTWSIRAGLGAPLQDAVDAASDLGTARIRALAGCGVERAIVVEAADAGDCVDAEMALEAHRPIRRAAHHLRMDLVLVTSDPDSAESLGYERWVSDRGCSPGLGFLCSEALESLPELQLCLDCQLGAAGADEVITAPLDASVSPDLLRHASRVLAGR